MKQNKVNYKLLLRFLIIIILLSLMWFGNKISLYIIITLLTFCNEIISSQLQKLLNLFQKIAEKKS